MPLRPVRVAVLDSGVDASHEALKGRVVGATAWNYGVGGVSPAKALRRTANNDLCGHGTGVASIIAAMAPNARIEDYRVLGADNLGLGRVVLDGLEAALEGDAEVINISIAIGKKEWWGRTSKLLEEAYRRGKIVVASKRNFPRPDDLGIPAEIPTAISVDSGRFASSYLLHYFTCSAIEFSARGESVLAARAGGGWTRLTGASFATPVVTALCALFRGANPGLPLFEAKAILKCWAERAAELSAISPPDPVEAAPACAIAAAGQCLVDWNCPKCGAGKGIADSVTVVHCDKCGAVSRREALLDPRAYFDTLEALRARADSRLPFHNSAHAQDVVAAVYAILRHYPRMGAVHRKALLFAALRHDFCYVDDPRNHEEASAREARTLSLAYGYRDAFADEVEALIRATHPSHVPLTLQEKIIRDADLFHIGTPAYQARSAALRSELAGGGQTFADAEWARREAAFLAAHRFNLPWLERERREARAAAIEKLKSFFR